MPRQSSTGWESFRERTLEKYHEALDAGAVDPPIVPLLEIINENPDYVTTSSCSGRIVLLATGKSEKKGESFFYRKWHRPVIADEVWTAIMNFSGKMRLWFKVDPFILHVSARNVAAAELLVRTARIAGVKIAGIISVDKHRAVVELRGIDTMALPVWDGRILISREYGEYIVREANRKITRNIGRLERLARELETVL